MLVEYGIPQMKADKSLNDLKDSINILKGNIGLFYKGNRSVYRVIAVQLGLLLCDGKEDNNSLIPRVFGGQVNQIQD